MLLTVRFPVFKRSKINIVTFLFRYDIFFINLQQSKLETEHITSSNKMLTKILRGLCSFCKNISCFSVPYRPSHGSISVQTFIKASFCFILITAVSSLK